MTTRLKISGAIIPRNVFTQPGSKPVISRLRAAASPRRQVPELERVVAAKDRSPNSFSGLRLRHAQKNGRLALQALLSKGLTNSAKRYVSAIGTRFLRQAQSGTRAG
jgi:hypothetical protein